MAYRLEPFTKLPADMKKVLIYYPKTFDVLKPITLSVTNDEEENKNSREMKKRLIFRYKKKFFQYFHFEQPSVSQKILDQNLPMHFRFLKINPKTTRKRPDIIKLISKRSKAFRIAEISLENMELLSILTCLRKISSLCFLHIDSMPFLPLQEYKRILSASKFNLEELAITGYLPQKYKKDPKELLDVFLIAFSLPKLKSFKFNSKDSDIAIVDKIPFDILKEKY